MQSYFIKRVPTRIQRLNVMSNRLRETDIVDLRHLTELTVLELSDNYLQKLIYFGELRQLRDLRADKNKIKELEDLSATCLEHLSLRGNRLIFVDCAQLPCAYMKNLLLNKNAIAKVQSIGLLQQLKILNLDHNLLSHFESTTPLASLHTLRLSHNQLRHLHAGWFPTVSVLYADCNLLHKIDGLAILSMLESFSVRDQQRNWEMNFDALPPARNLYLSGNPFPDLIRCSRLDLSLNFLNLVAVV
ncbi:hypothetical protein BDF19DRAFT_11849 [Syncephalis fuscata]|nr:hypothetical protein BDF19DRAFT_11849 [Syncephalis fuscata]